jgi:hypothetical protein
MRGRHLAGMAVIGDLWNGLVKEGKPEDSLLGSREHKCDDNNVKECDGNLWSEVFWQRMDRNDCLL